MKKRLLALLLSVICLFSMAGCGSTDSSVKAEGTKAEAANTESSQNADSAESNTGDNTENSEAEKTENTENAESLELTMYFPVSVGGGPDALIDGFADSIMKRIPM